MADQLKQLLNSVVASAGNLLTFLSTTTTANSQVVLPNSPVHIKIAVDRSVQRIFYALDQIEVDIVTAEFKIKQRLNELKEIYEKEQEEKRKLESNNNIANGLGLGDSTTVDLTGNDDGDDDKNKQQDQTQDPTAGMIDDEIMNLFDDTNENGDFSLGGGDGTNNDNEPLNTDDLFMDNLF